MPDRIVLIDKPLRWTSFDVVKKIRKPLLEERRLEMPLEERSSLKKIKVGHAGTLDPLATGLLILCSGKFTSRISEIQDAEKEYTGTITIGSTTESYDLETKPMDHLPYDQITPERILEVAKTFIGEQLQMPPIHSAKKIEGVRAYHKARKGEEVILKQNLITIQAFEIEAIRLPEIDFRVVCTKGTYIRSLAHDFGKKLETGAHLSTLCRTRIGTYLVSDALSPEKFLLQLAELQNIQ